MVVDWLEGQKGLMLIGQWNLHIGDMAAINWLDKNSWSYLIDRFGVGNEANLVLIIGKIMF